MEKEKLRAKALKMYAELMVQKIKEVALIKKCG